MSWALAKGVGRAERGEANKVRKALSAAWIKASVVMRQV
jgi:hypothetical protein